MNPTQGEKSATGETAQECHVMPPLKPVLSAMGQIMQSYDYVLLPFPQGPCSQKSVTEEAAEEDNSKSSPISECEPVSSSVQSVAQPNFKLNEPVTTPLNAKITVPADDCNDGDSETLSFEVLGKNSIDIQASSLASYVDIQQKSMEIVCKLLFYFIQVAYFNIIKYIFFVYIGLHLDDSTNVCR